MHFFLGGSENAVGSVMGEGLRFMAELCRLGTSVEVPDTYPSKTLGASVGADVVVESFTFIDLPMRAIFLNNSFCDIVNLSRSLTCVFHPRRIVLE